LKKQLVKLFNVGISVAMITLALNFLDWNGIVASLKLLDPLILVAALIICTLQFFFLGVRWYLMVNKIVPIPFLNHMGHYFIATFVNTFTPANIGGDLYRVFKLKAYVAKTKLLVLEIIRERVIGLLSFFLVYILCYLLALALFIDGQSGFNEAFHIGAMIILTGIVCILFFSKIMVIGSVISLIKPFPKIIDIFNKLKKMSLFSSNKEFVILMMPSLLAFFMWLLALQIISVQLEVDLAWYIMGIIAASVELIRLIPISIQGIGIRESAFAFLFLEFGQSAETGFVLGMTVYLLLSVSIVFAGLIGWLLMSIASDTKAFLHD